MLLYRIGQNKFIKDLSGKGAGLFGGRWNYPGYNVIYTAETVSLAILEYIIKAGVVENEINQLSLAYINVEDNSSIINLDYKTLPKSWNSYPASDKLKKLGTDWLISGKSLLLKVPAVSAPDSFNILVNPTHPDFFNVSLAKIIKYQPDIRLRK